jgi:hypothetical protein
MSINTNIIGFLNHSRRVFFYSNDLQPYSLDSQGFITPQPLADAQSIVILTPQYSTSPPGWSFQMDGGFFDGQGVKPTPTLFAVSSSLYDGNMIPMGVPLTLTIASSGETLTVNMAGIGLYRRGRCGSPLSPYETMRALQANDDELLYADTDICSSGLSLTYCTPPNGCGTTINGQTCYSACSGNSVCTNVNQVNGKLACSSDFRSELQHTAKTSVWLWVGVVLFMLVIIGVVLLMIFRPRFAMMGMSMPVGVVTPGVVIV